MAERPARPTPQVAPVATEAGEFALTVTVAMTLLIAPP